MDLTDYQFQCITTILDSSSLNSIDKMWEWINDKVTQIQNKCKNILNEPSFHILSLEPNIGVAVRQKENGNNYEATFEITWIDYGICSRLVISYQEEIPSKYNYWIKCRQKKDSKILHKCENIEQLIGLVEKEIDKICLTEYDIIPTKKDFLLANISQRCVAIEKISEIGRIRYKHSKK